nr:nuclear transport factor 2 family protein [Granulicella arctica]
MSLSLQLRPFSRTKLFVLFLLVVALGAGRAAVAALPHASRHDAKREIEVLEEQWRTALIAGDVAALDRLMSDDFIGISMTGQVNTKMQQLDRVRNRTLVITKMDLSDVKIKLVGSVAIVTSLSQIEGMNDGLSMQGTFRYTRVYQRLPSGVWETTNFEATRVPGGRRPPPPAE